MRNSYSEEVFKSLDVDSNGFEISPNSYDITEPTCQSHQEVNQFDEFSCFNAIDVSQEIIVDTENLQKPFDNNTVSNEHENIDNEHEFEQNSVIDTVAVQSERVDGQSTINFCEIDQKRNTVRQAIRNVQFKDGKF